MIAMDYGSDSKLRLHTATGPIEPPKTTRGLVPSDKFAETLRMLLATDDVVTESPTVGSSGAESELIHEVVASSSYRLYTVSARAVKNHVKTHGLGQIDDAEAASIIYEVAGNPARLQVWRYRKDDEKLKRIHTSVRPYDKRNYRDPQVDEWMSLLPPFASLPDDMRELLGNGKKRQPDYAPARVLPLAMALTEPAATSRDGYEKVLGLGEHGYPSFYRRATVALMQRVAKDLAGVRTNAEVSQPVRKEAWRVTRRHIRFLYHMAKMGIPYPAEGTKSP